jgi:hypothetical protein
VIKTSEVFGNLRGLVNTHLFPMVHSKLSTLKCLPLTIAFVVLVSEVVRALPPVEDKPEEVLRAEIITGAQSPIDGKPITATEYAQLQAELATAPPEKIELSRKIVRTVRLLRLRKFIKTVFPFIPIK